MKLHELNILLADDDADDCLFFKDAVTAFIPATNFTEVHDGEQLMQLLKDESTKLPDVLFLDLNMPRKNGFECLTEIKQHQQLRSLPVVIFSTSNSPGSMETLFKAGADVYIRKPRNFNQLVQIIQHALPMTSENITAKARLKYVLNA
jgi:CheY-like chemotaxis protein